MAVHDPFSRRSKATLAAEDPARLLKIEECDAESELVRGHAEACADTRVETPPAAVRHEDGLRVEFLYDTEDPALEQL